MLENQLYTLLGESQVKNDFLHICIYAFLPNVSHLCHNNGSMENGFATLKKWDPPIIIIALLSRNCDIITDLSTSSEQSLYDRSGEKL